MNTLTINPTVTTDELKIIAVDYVRHEFNASTPVADEPVEMHYVVVRADNGVYEVAIDDDGDVVDCQEK